MSNQAEHLRVIEGDSGSGGQDPLVGTTIDGRYLIERVLGEGGMGLVYKAKHVVLNKPLAIKVLRPDVSRDGEIIARFKQEAQSASAIGNQHIIDISDFGTLPDQSTYFVMEFLEGTDLTGAIENQQPIEPRRVIHIAKQLCRALGAAHDSGIVHRDLKPDNIYLIKRGSDPDFVKVLDFGIAKVGGSSSKLTRAGQVFGTPHYMSPEQCSGTGVDHRTDIYAIGVILYEMVVGHVPFDADNLMGILTKHLYEEPVPPRQKRADCPEDLEAVVLKAMTKDRDNRYQTMAEFLADLERLDAGMTPEATQSLRLAAEAAAPKKSKSGPLIAIAAIVLLAGAGGAAAVVMGGDPPPEAPAPVAATPVVPTPTTPEPVGGPETEPEAEAQPAAPEPPPAAMVRIISDPAGAEVYQGEALIGTTPFEVPRPDESAPLSLELRLAGHQPKTFAISHLTRPGDLTIGLEEVRSGRRGGGSRRSTPEASGEDPSAMSMTEMRRNGVPQTEVLDPWAN